MQRRSAEVVLDGVEGARHGVDTRSRRCERGQLVDLLVQVGAGIADLVCALSASDSPQPTAVAATRRDATSRPRRSRLAREGHALYEAVHRTCRPFSAPTPDFTSSAPGETQRATPLPPRASAVPVGCRAPARTVDGQLLMGRAARALRRRRSRARVRPLGRTGRLVRRRSPGSPPRWRPSRRSSLVAPAARARL